MKSYETEEIPDLAFPLFVVDEKEKEVLTIVLERLKTVDTHDYFLCNIIAIVGRTSRGPNMVEACLRLLGKIEQTIGHRNLPLSCYFDQKGYSILSLDSNTEMIKLRIRWINLLLNQE